jgi:hypothetical protein
MRPWCASFEGADRDTSAPRGATLTGRDEMQPHPARMGRSALLLPHHRCAGRHWDDGGCRAPRCPAAPHRMGRAGYQALSVTPGIQVGGFWDAFEASWLYAIVVTIASWLVTARPDHHQSERCRDDERDLHDDLPAAEPGLTILGGAVGPCLTRRGRPSRPRPVPRCRPRRPLPDRGRELSGLPRVVHRPFIRRG